jgi:hypothetical protein
LVSGQRFETGPPEYEAGELSTQQGLSAVFAYSSRTYAPNLPCLFLETKKNGAKTKVVCFEQKIMETKAKPGKKLS